MALTDKLTAIANAIRSKTGKTDALTLEQMPSEIKSISSGGITPSGTKNITANGEFDVTQFASVLVNVASKTETVTVTVPADKTSAFAILSNNAFLNAHHSDPNLVCLMFVESAQQTNNYILMNIVTNTPIGGFLYGIGMRSGGETVTYIVNKTNNLDGVSYNGTMYYENGKLMVYATSNRILGAGTYKIVMCCINGE